MPAVAPPVAYQVPSGGVRFDPHITSHLSMSSLGSTARSSQDQWDSYNRQQIYKKVKDWFTEWRPWQKRMLLCGLTNRCSTSQLESLATTLEPLFHRDFVTSLRKRYPSAPFRHQKAREREKKENEKQDIRKLAREIIIELIDSAFVQCSTDACAISDALVEDSEEQVRAEVMEPNSKGGTGNDVHPEGERDDQSDRQVEVNYLDEHMNKHPNDHAGETNNSQTKEYNTECSEIPEVNVAIINYLENKMGEDGIALHLQESNDVGTTEVKDVEGDNIDGLAINPEGTDEGEEFDKDTDDHSFIKSTPKFDGPRKIFISRPFLSVFEYAVRSKVESGSASLKDNLGLLLTRQHFSIENQQHIFQSFPQSSPPDANDRTIHRHRSGIRTADIRTNDFFERRISRLGPLQAQLRTGSVCRPSRMGSIDAPVQKLFKHSKFWGLNPKEGKTFIRPKKSQLKWHFREQVKRVWEWISNWEEWEKLNLLTNVVKQCDQDLLNYLTQCMIERLRERVDISWLPDPLLLLIFSYLPTTDIDAASRVCRRWRYLSSTNELWMIKCQEFGMDQGISNILELVKASGLNGQDVDWRLAYMELQGITEQAKSSLPIPSRLGFQGPTPDGKRRVGGKFISASIPDYQHIIFGSLIAKLQRKVTAQSQGSHLSSSTALSQQVGQVAPTATSHGGHGSIRPPVLVSVHEKLISSQGPDPSFSFPSRGVSRFQSVWSPMKDERPVMSQDGPKESMVSSRKTNFKKEKQLSQDEKLPKKLQGPVKQFRGKQKTEDDEDEPARDVRPDLIQAKDVLHKSPVTSKMWSEDDAKEARERLESYVGKVTPIKRVRKLQGHMDAVLCIEFDARRLVSGSMDRAIRIWDIRSGRSLHKFYGHKGGVTCLTFDNETLYSGSWDTAIMVWDLVNFERLEVLTGHKGSISCLAMNDDLLFSGSHDGTVRIWQRSTWLCRRVLEGHTSHILSMALSGSQIITGSSDRTIRIVDFQTGVAIRTLKTANPVDTLWLTGSLILTGDAAGHLYIWNKESGEAEVGIKAHDAPITRVTYHSNHIYTASSDATIKEWDLMTMACVRSLQGHKGPIRDFKVSRKSMVSAGADGHIRLWDKIIPLFSLGEEQSTSFEVVDQRKI